MSSTGSITIMQLLNRLTGQKNPRASAPSKPRKAELIKIRENSHSSLEQAREVEILRTGVVIMPAKVKTFTRTLPWFIYGVNCFAAKTLYSIMYVYECIIYIYECIIFPSNTCEQSCSYPYFNNMSTLPNTILTID